MRCNRLKISIAQLQASQDKEVNINKAKEYVRKAKEEKADIVVFPEIYMIFVPVKSGIKLADIAEPIDGNLINREGEVIYTYRKTHLYDAFITKESDRVIPGDKPAEVIETDIGKIGLLICYEIRFPEISRNLTLDGADVLIVPTAWVRGAMK